MRDDYGLPIGEYSVNKVRRTWLNALPSSQTVLGEKDITKERGPTHGPFSDNARISQGIKDLLRSGKNWGKLYPEEKEAIDQIALKLSRVTTGEIHYLDNWVDIVGYGTLARNKLSGN